MYKLLQTDEQTINDLALIGRPGKASVFELYNKTITQGGSARLLQLFREPVSHAEEINRRAAIYHFFSREDHQFPLDAVTVGAVAYYMENDDIRSQLQPGGQSFGQKFRSMLAADATTCVRPCSRSTRENVVVGLRPCSEVEAGRDVADTQFGLFPVRRIVQPQSARNLAALTFDLIESHS